MDRNGEDTAPEIGFADRPENSDSRKNSNFWLQAQFQALPISLEFSFMLINQESLKTSLHYRISAASVRGVAMVFRNSSEWRDSACT